MLWYDGGGGSGDDNDNDDVANMLYVLNLLKSVQCLVSNDTVVVSDRVNLIYSITWVFFNAPKAKEKCEYDARMVSGKQIRLPR